MQIQESNYESFKKTMIEQGMTYENDKDYREAFDNLVGYFEILIQMDQEQKTKNTPVE